MLTEAYAHVKRTWNHVLSGHSSTSEKVEAAAEAAVAVAAAVGCSKFGLWKIAGESKAVLHESKTVLPQLLISDGKAAVAASGAEALVGAEVTASKAAEVITPTVFKLPKPSIERALEVMRNRSPETFVDESAPLEPGWHVSRIRYAMQDKLKAALGIPEGFDVKYSDIPRMKQDVPKAFPVPGGLSVLETEPAFIRGYERFGLVRKLTVDYTGHRATITAENSVEGLMLQDIARIHLTEFPERIVEQPDNPFARGEIQNLHYAKQTEVNGVSLKDVQLRWDGAKPQGFYTDATGQRHSADWLIKYRQLG